MPARLLVADDEPDIRVLVRVRLRHLPVEIVEATDGAVALALVEGDGLPDMAILDQRMPHRTGLEVAAVLRDARPELPVALFSAFLDAELVRAADALEVHTCSKSDLPALVSWVEQQLGGAAAGG